MISRPKLLTLCESYPDLGYRIMRNVAADMTTVGENCLGELVMPCKSTIAFSTFLPCVSQRILA
jgi:hypothetical protein